MSSSTFSSFRFLSIFLWWNILCRHSLTSGKLPHYTKGAIAFLQEYGDYYHLLDTFIAKDLSNTYEIVKTSQRATESIAEKYRIRNYSNYHQWEASVEQLTEWNTTYYLHGGDDKYNNRYRYGPDFGYDHFAAIFFHLDPWTQDGATVNFVGRGPNLQGKKMICRFFDPVEASTGVAVEHGFTDEFGHTLHRENIIYCPIPAEVKAALIADINSVTLDLILEEGGQTKVLLKSVRVQRTHELDRRNFNISLSAITNDMNDPMAIEWVLYHMLLGVEHFYIFDQRPAKSVNMWNEAMRPLLDANIVTVVPYHYVWDGFVQTTIFQTTLQHFGPHNKWLGFPDTDEFFLPTGCLNYTEAFSDDPPNLLAQHLRCLGTEWDVIPGVMYDTMEMGCDDPQNKFLSHSEGRVAVTTHCTTQGLLFHELKVSHGKMFLKASKIKFMATPHRRSDYNIIYGENSVGLFRHFNAFKYTKTTSESEKQRFYADSMHSIGNTDLSLRAFTLQLLELHGLIRKKK